MEDIKDIKQEYRDDAYEGLDRLRILLELSGEIKDEIKTVL